MFQQCVYLQDAAALFEQLEGISPEPSATYSNPTSELGLGLPSHGRFAPEEHLQSSHFSRPSSPERQISSLSGWNSNIAGDRNLLEHLGQVQQQSSERSQAGSQSSLLPYDDRLWGRSGASSQPEQDPRTS